MKKNPSRCTAPTPQSREVSIPTPTGSMTETTQPLSCTKGMHMKQGDNEVLLCQDCSTPLYRWFLSRIDWVRILKQQRKERT